jgi:hypothetical protein
MSHVVVTAYYPIPTGKHTRDDYKSWYNIFFKCVTSPVICFCPSEMEQEFKSIAGSNVTIIVRDFYSFNMMSNTNMDRWKEWHKIDPEKHIHSPQLYAIWAAKQEFVREAMKISDYSIYTWCDIGCFRVPRNGSFEYTHKYIQPNKITCLYIPNYDFIGGGVLAGDKDAWNIFSKNFLEELNNNINGKDQIIYKRILNSSNAVIIHPNNLYGDFWFFLTYIFSMPIPYNERI